jgi:hypothetical protein
LRGAVELECKGQGRVLWHALPARESEDCGPGDTRSTVALGDLARTRERILNYVGRPRLLSAVVPCPGKGSKAMQQDTPGQPNLSYEWIAKRSEHSSDWSTCGWGRPRWQPRGHFLYKTGPGNRQRGAETGRGGRGEHTQELRTGPGATQVPRSTAAAALGLLNSKSYRSDSIYKTHSRNTYAGILAGSDRGLCPICRSAQPCTS